MKHIKSWQERVNHGDSIYAKATALECEVAELRAALASQVVQEPYRYLHRHKGSGGGYEVLVTPEQRLTAYRDTLIEEIPLYAAPLAAGEQDSVHLTERSGEAATGREDGGGVPGARGPECALVCQEHKAGHDACKLGACARTSGVDASQVQSRDTVTAEQAQIALDNMDDYARMGGIVPGGALQVLQKFIEQHTPAVGVTGCPESGKHCRVIDGECQTCGITGVKGPDHG